MKSRSKLSSRRWKVLVSVVAAAVLASVPGLVQPADSFGFGFLSQWSAGDGPEGLDVGPDGTVYVAEDNTNRIEQFSSTGAFIRSWGSTGTGPGQFDAPTSVGINSANGDVYIFDANNERIEQFSSVGTFIREWGSSGTGTGQFNGSLGLKVGNDSVYTTECGQNRIQQFTLTGTFIRTWGSAGAGPGQFSCPSGIDVAPSGDVYVGDTGTNDRIQQFSSTGAFIRSWGSTGTGPGQFDSPDGVGFDVAGNVWVMDSTNNRVQEFTSTGQSITTFGSFGTGPGQFDGAYELALDCRGNLYVADFGNDRVQKFGEAGAGEPPCSQPSTSPAPAAVPGQIQSLVLGSKAFKAVNTGGAIFSRAKSKATIGTTVSYGLSSAATASFSVERATKGRKAGKKCQKQTRKNRKRKKCTLFKPVSGGFSHVGAAGPNSFKFSGRINNKALKPGNYRLVALTGSTVKRAPFKIVR